MKTEFLKNFWKKIPKLPLSALIFYLGIMILWNFQIIPAPIELIHLLERLYDRYGFMALFVASILEGLVYLGLYFAGSTIIVMVILFSDGTFSTFLNISLIVTLALIITSVINYVFGRHIISRPLKENKEIKEKRKASKGLFLSCLHPNALAFYFFNLGLKRKNMYRIIFVPFVMIPYGFLLAYLFYQLKPLIIKGAEEYYVFLIVIIIWLIIAYIVENVKKNEIP